MTARPSTNTNPQTATDLAKVIAGCGSNQAIALGTLKDDLPNLVPITVPRNVKNEPGAITRSRDFINYRLGYLPGASSTLTPKGCRPTSLPRSKPPVECGAPC
jgi:hypothetical protein